MTGVQTCALPILAVHAVKDYLNPHAHCRFLTYSNKLPAAHGCKTSQLTCRRVCNFYTQRVILASLTARPPLSCCRHPSVEAIKGLSGKTLKRLFRTVRDIKPKHLQDQLSPPLDTQSAMRCPLAGDEIWTHGHVWSRQEPPRRKSTRSSHAAVEHLPDYLAGSCGVASPRPPDRRRDPCTGRNRSCTSRLMR